MLLLYSCKLTAVGSDSLCKGYVFILHCYTARGEQEMQETHFERRNQKVSMLYIVVRYRLIYYLILLLVMLQWLNGE